MSPANFVLIVCTEGKDSFDRKYIDNWTPVFLGINPSSRRWDGKFRKIQSLRNPFKSLVISNFLEQVDAANLAVVSLYIIIIDRSWVNERPGIWHRCLCCLQFRLAGSDQPGCRMNIYLFDAQRRGEVGELIRLSVIELARFQSEEGRLISSIEFIFSSFPICGTSSVIFFFFFTSRWVYILYTRSKIKIWGIYFVS